MVLIGRYGHPAPGSGFEPKRANKRSDCESGFSGFSRTRGLQRKHRFPLIEGTYHGAWQVGNRQPKLVSAAMPL